MGGDPQRPLSHGRSTATVRVSRPAARHGRADDAETPPLPGRAPLHREGHFIGAVVSDARLCGGIIRIVFGRGDADARSSGDRCTCLPGKARRSAPTLSSWVTVR
jgi:hypothetical protein